MHDIYVSDVLRLCDGKLLNGDENLVLDNFCTDSRKIQKKDVYLGFRGEKVDGNLFYKEAIEKGASCCILDRKIAGADFKDCTVILVDDTLECVQKLASYKRSLYDIPVIAITGSAGKTSTKDLIYSVVSKKYKTHKTIGNYNNHLGVPLTILGLHDHEALVIEMGMNHLREIALLSSIARPTISVITNIGTAHIGNLGSRENILKAKMEILEGMIGKDIVINNDNDLLCDKGLELKDKYNVYSVSIDSFSDYKACNIDEDVFSSKFDIANKTTNINVNVGGRVNIYNALMAYTIGDILKIDDKKIKEGIFEFKLTGSRLERKVNKKGVIVIDDTYNANYDSMVSSIELLGKVKSKRKIAILGDMLELGEYSDELHTKLGDKIVSNKIDILITVGKYSKLIAKRAVELGFDKENIYEFNNEREIDEYILDMFRDEDVVLIKGSHGVHLELVVDRIMK